MVPFGGPSPFRALAAVCFALGLSAAHASPAQTCIPGFSPGPVSGLPASAFVVAMPDLDRDGRPDLIFQADGGTGWALNQGNGRFVPAGFAAGLSGWIAVGDLDGDGVPDAVLVTPGRLGVEPEISTYLSDGSGGFRLAASVPPPESQTAFSPVLADFDGDGILDLAVVIYDVVWVYVGDGRGGLRPNSYFRPGSPFIESLHSIDVQFGGRASLLVTTGTLHGFPGTPFSYFSEDIEVWTMKGGEWSEDATDILGSPRALDLATRDVNGDGLDDVVTVSLTPESGVSRIDTYLDRPGGYVLVSRFTGLPHPLLADFDGDGRLDLVLFDAGYLSSRKFSLQLGDGAGKFGPPRTFTLPASAFSLIAADVDGDGRADLIASGIDGSPPLLLLNTCERLAPAEPGPGLAPRPRGPR